MEAEEESERKSDNVLYDVIVKHCGGRIHEIARGISMACSIPRTYVERKLSDGTAKFRMSNKKSAENIKARITSLGGIAVIKKASE